MNVELSKWGTALLALGLVITSEGRFAEAQGLEVLSPVQSGPGDRVGLSVSASGRRIVLGAPLSDAPLQDSGAVYAYSVSNFSTSQPDGRLVPSVPLAGGNFGAAVSLSGDFVAVGAPLEDQGVSVDVGSVYVFSRLAQGWMQEARIVPPIPAAGLKFGFSVALSGSDLLIGAPGQNTRRGAVYRFKKISGAWTFQERWDPSNPIIQQNFGYSLGFDGTWAAIGMLQNAPEGSEPGRVHLFLNMGGSWSQAQVISASVPQYDNRFGGSVALSGNLLAVGAMGLNVGAANNGGAYTFELSNGTWTQRQILSPNVAQANQFAGASVAAIGSTTAFAEILVGAPFADGVLFDTGAVFPFRRIGGSFVSSGRLAGTGEEQGDLFGSALAFSPLKGNNRTLVGAPQDNARGARSGVGYFTRASPRIALVAGLVCIPPEC